MKEEEKVKTGSVKIDPDVYNDAAEYCKSNGIKMTFFATEAVKEKMQKLKEDGDNKK